MSCSSSSSTYEGDMLTQPHCYEADFIGSSIWEADRATPNSVCYDDSVHTYTDLSSSDVYDTSSPMDGFLGPDIDIYGYKQKHPENFDAGDVMLWIQTVAERSMISQVDQSFRPEDFAKLDGKQMKNMTEGEFVKRSSSWGKYIYQCWQELLRENSFLQPSVYAKPEPFEYTPADYVMDSLERDIAIYSFDGNDKFMSFPNLVSMPVEKKEPDNITDPPSPASSDASDSSQSPKKGRKPKGHLWEFVRDLLLDSRYNPTIIKWEDQKNGIFRFVKSSEVAKLWGIRKNNTSMTYEKMSRAMRYTRSKGKLESLPKDSKHPKKLCFKFSKDALEQRSTK